MRMPFVANPRQRHVRGWPWESIPLPEGSWLCPHNQILWNVTRLYLQGTGEIFKVLEAMVLSASSSASCCAHRSKAALAERFRSPTGDAPSPAPYPPRAPSHGAPPASHPSRRWGWKEAVPLPPRPCRRILKCLLFLPQPAISVINGRGGEAGQGEERSPAPPKGGCPASSRLMRLRRACKRSHRAGLKSHPNPTLNICSWVRAPGGSITHGF